MKPALFGRASVGTEGALGNRGQTALTPNGRPDLPLRRNRAPGGGVQGSESPRISSENTMNLALSSLLGSALLVAIPLTATPRQRADGAQPFAGGLLPAATQPIEIPPNRDLSLADLVDALAESTGLRFVVSSQTRQALNDTPAGLLSGGVVAPGEVYSFTQSVLKRHRIVMERLTGVDVPVAALYWLDGGRDTAALNWSTVAAESIDSVRSHQALLVQCTVNVTPSDARQIATSMRSLIRDTNYQATLALNNSTVLLRGVGSDVAKWVEMIQLAGRNEEAYLERLRSMESE